MKRELLSKETLDIINKLNEKNIKYIVLRGYIPISALNESKDIDILVDEDDFLELNSIMNSMGWKKQEINTARFPHVFFLKDTKDGQKIFDVVNGLYFSKYLYQIQYEKYLNNRILFKETIYVPNFDDALELLLLHICFDKGHLSKENKKRLLNLVEFGNFHNYDNLHEAEKILNSDEFLKKTRKYLESKMMIDKSIKRFIFRYSIQQFNLFIYRVRRLFKL